MSQSIQAGRVSAQNHYCQLRRPSAGYFLILNHFRESDRQGQAGGLGCQPCGLFPTNFRRRSRGIRTEQYLFGLIFEPAP